MDIRDLLNKFNLTSRVMVLVYIFLFILTSSQAINFYQSSKASKVIDTISHRDMPLIKLITEIATLQQETKTLFKDAMRFGNNMQTSMTATESFYNTQEQFNSTATVTSSKIGETIKFVETTLVQLSDNEIKSHYKTILNNLKNIESDNNSLIGLMTLSLRYIMNGAHTNAMMLTEKVDRTEGKLGGTLHVLLKNVVQNTKNSSHIAALSDRSSNRVANLLLLIGTLIASLLCFLVTKSIITRLKYGELIAQDIENGSKDRQIPVHSPDEIGQLIRSINKVLSKIPDNDTPPAEDSSKIKEKTISNHLSI